MSLNKDEEREKPKFINDDLGFGEKLRFVGFDFETLTPRGRPPEPFEIGFVLLDGNAHLVQEEQRFMAPPSDVPFTEFDIKQTGVRPEDVKGKPNSIAVLGEIEGILQQYECVLIAHNAQYDYGILSRHSAIMPYTINRPVIDTIKLAKVFMPGLEKYGLSKLAAELDLPIPEDRHRSVPDVKLMLRVFYLLVKKMKAQGHNNLSDIIKFGGITDWGIPKQLSLI